LIGLVRRNDAAALEAAIASGLSPNPCNRFGESLVHNICRRGNHEMLDIFIRNGCTLQFADDYGRTPLHDACWAAEPAFDIFQTIMKHDARLVHMIDARGHLPLNYVRKEHWGEWIEFLEANKDIYWPPRSSSDPEQGSPQHALEGPNTRPIPDPKNALSLDLARLVASGRMTPEEAKILNSEEEEATMKTYDGSSTVLSYDDCDDSDSYSSGDDSESLGDEDDVLLTELPSLLRFKLHA
jgi:hypothetical protein